jgi:coproporphyrinogen III oxidase-like Fe-S oxidoreductase
MCSSGVNRVSLGVQTWNQKALGAAGRAHSVEDADTAVSILKAAASRRRPLSPQKQQGRRQAAAAGAVAAEGDGLLRSWSLDLISGLPCEDEESWAATLAKTVLEVQPPHISVYDLQV